MKEVFLSLFRVLEEKIPNEETRKDIYAELIPALYWESDGFEGWLSLLESEDHAFDQACQDFREENM